jgi:hypothetical protein
MTLPPDERCRSTATATCLGMTRKASTKAQLNPAQGSARIAEKRNEFTTELHRYQEPFALQPEPHNPWRLTQHSSPQKLIGTSNKARHNAV